MAGTGGIGGGSVKAWLKDDSPSAPCSSNNGHGRAEASVGNPGNPNVTITFTFPDGSTKVVTLKPLEEVKLAW